MKYLCVLVLFLAGCQQTPAQRVGTAFVAHRTATNTMSTLAEAGEVDLDTAENFESFRAPAWDLILVAKEDVLDGDGDDLTAVNALDMLIPLLEQMEAASD